MILLNTFTFYFFCISYLQIITNISGLAAPADGQYIAVRLIQRERALGTRLRFTLIEIEID